MATSVLLNVLLTVIMILGVFSRSLNYNLKYCEGNVHELMAFGDHATIELEGSSPLFEALNGSRVKGRDIGRFCTFRFSRDADRYYFHILLSGDLTGSMVAVYPNPRPQFFMGGTDDINSTELQLFYKDSGDVDTKSAFVVDITLQSSPLDYSGLICTITIPVAICLPCCIAGWCSLLCSRKKAIGGQAAVESSPPPVDHAAVQTQQRGSIFHIVWENQTNHVLEREQVLAPQSTHIECAENPFAPPSYDECVHSDQSGDSRLPSYCTAIKSIQPAYVHRCYPAALQPSEDK